MKTAAITDFNGPILFVTIAIFFGWMALEAIRCWRAKRGGR
jgi:hypothetical protein